MRKRIVAQSQSDASPLLDDDWLNVAELAVVEITSEDATHSIESALQAGPASGWRAAAPGKQTIRHPQRTRQAADRDHLDAGLAKRSVQTPPVKPDPSLIDPQHKYASYVR